MTILVEQISLENPAFHAYAYWSAILIIKMVLMSVLTRFFRHKKEVNFSLLRFREFKIVLLMKAFINPEDLKGKFQAKLHDPDVERVRRAHRNDLENIPILLVVEFLFLISNPNAFVAVYLIKIAAIARIIHTIGYAIFPIQKLRGLGFLVSMAITMYMAIYSLLYFR